VLEVTGLSVSYGAVAALRDVTFTVPDGSITAVLGANGAGKTTLLRTLSALVPPVAGTATWSGTDLIGRRVEDVVTLGIGHVPEGRGVITELSVEENLRLGGLWRGEKAVLTRDLDTVYAMFPPLAERRRRIADTLSGGERQMLAIGRAIMARPSLMLLDEPSLGLAPRVAAQIMATLRSLRDEQRLTVLLVEQNARSALSVADAGIVLNLGRIVATGPADQLAADEQLRHSYLGL
jgi:branched-chain amino acid transport system ATP-binding protein